MNWVRITTLAEFLSQPNIKASPDWKLINRRLRHNLVKYINLYAKRFKAVQELRCIVPPLSPVPDISVVLLERLPEKDEPLNGAPDLLIEICSPEQSTVDLQSNIINCLSNGTQLVWLIDITRQQIWVWQGDDHPRIYSGMDILPTLEDLPELTVNAVIALTRSQ